MRQQRGKTSYHAGLAAEETVARHYLARGHTIEARRYKRKSGEIDLVARKGCEVIFIEVKKSKTHDQAAQSVSGRQLMRILATASEFLSGEPSGQDTPSRVDVALVDRDGRVSCLENVSAG